MQVLASARVRDAVIASPDQSAAVEMMLRDSGAGIDAAIADVRAAWEGRIAPVLIWEKHPLLIGAALFVCSDGIAAAAPPISSCVARDRRKSAVALAAQLRAQNLNNNVP